MTAEREHAVLVAGLQAVCAYELTALNSRGRLPTISRLTWRLPVWARFLIWLGLGVGFFDHFVTRRWV